MAKQPVGKGRAAKTNRQKNAELRASSGITPKEHLDHLDDRLGVGVGAAKERAKLARKKKEAK